MKKHLDDTILIELVKRSSCRICNEVTKELISYQRQKKHVNLKIFDVEKGDTISEKLQCYITPAVWVEGQLWYLGGFDINRFDQKISELN
jgi:hypothetical protein